MGVRRRTVAWGLAALVGFALTADTASDTAPVTGPSLVVDAQRDVHAIPDTIYGVNWASDRLRTALRLPLNRWGGNETSLYDYRTNTYNDGIDWYFENQVGRDVNHDVQAWVRANRATGTASLVTLPMVGWLADGAKPYGCAFSVARYGPQDAHDRTRPDCGNGLVAGKPLTGNDPTDFAIQVEPARHAAEMVAALVAEHGTASAGGVQFYELDNEPSLWHKTHRSVHPQPLTRDELLTRSITTAEAVKNVDPGASIIGPSSWGYCAWLFAPADGSSQDICDPPTSDPKTPLAAVYVRAFKDYADTHGGRRLLDYLDEHHYPQPPGVALTGSAGSTATQAVRLRSTRSLWDPTYTSESWIGQEVNAPPLRFIRKLREWAAVYPGTKTSISEYNWGGTDSINGAVAQADVLGIFGRERLDLATYWNWDNAIDGSPVEWAFRLYRNHDGKGGRFQATGIHAASSDQGRLSIYASRGPRAMTIVVVNKTFGALRAPVQIRNYPHDRIADSYTLAPSNPRGFARKYVLTGDGGFSFTYPAQSATLIRIPRA